MNELARIAEGQAYQEEQTHKIIDTLSQQIPPLDYQVLPDKKEYLGNASYYVYGFGANVQIDSQPTSVRFERLSLSMLDRIVLSQRISRELYRVSVEPASLDSGVKPEEHLIPLTSKEHERVERLYKAIRKAKTQQAGTSKTPTGITRV